MKTLKVEGVYRMAYETFEDVATELPQFIEGAMLLGGLCRSVKQLQRAG